MDVIFLDVDGVLATPCSRRLNRLLGRGPASLLLDPRAMRHLRWLVRRSGAAVVLSSTWRDGLYLEECRPLTDNLFRRLADNGTPVFDAAPVLDSGDKGDEIAAWLAAHPCRRFVILDDHDCFGRRPALHCRWVRVPGRAGLRRRQAMQALRVLQDPR